MRVKDRVRTCENCVKPECESKRRDYAAEIAALEVSTSGNDYVKDSLRYRIFFIFFSDAA